MSPGYDETLTLDPCSWPLSLDPAFQQYLWFYQRHVDQDRVRVRVRGMWIRIGRQLKSRMMSKPIRVALQPKPIRVALQPKPIRL